MKAKLSYLSESWTTWRKGTRKPINKGEQTMPNNQRSSQSYTRARRSHIKHHHRGQQTLPHEVMQAWGGVDESQQHLACETRSFSTPFTVACREREKHSLSSLTFTRAQWACRSAPDPSAPRAASDFDPTSHADFGAATHPGVGGTHRCRATVERC